MSIRRKNYDKDNIFLYTRSTPKPLISDTMKEARIFQLVFAIGAFTNLAIVSVAVNDGFYSDLSLSGLSIMCLVAISALLVSFSSLFVYSYPAFLGVPPHRHKRFSRVEVMVDLLYVGLWLSSSTAMAFYNPPDGTITIFNDGVRKDFNRRQILETPNWKICWAFGYLSAFMFSTTFIQGVRDIYFYGL
ncbi:hypothetical protein HDU92_006946 [Lobulomyces angularis]|nr:hypothetical protein HDU92_006946 [Lobulomyces angularis]